MIYLTQLIFIKKGKEAIFHRFEDIAISLMEKYSGKIIHRIRPQKEAFISGEKNIPYEIHFISFESEEYFTQFMNDEKRKSLIHLKEESITSAFLVKGNRIS